MWSEKEREGVELGAENRGRTIGFRWQEGAAAAVAGDGEERSTRGTAKVLSADLCSPRFPAQLSEPLSKLYSPAVVKPVEYLKSSPTAGPWSSPLLGKREERVEG